MRSKDLALHFDRRGMYKGANPLTSAKPIIRDPSQTFETEPQTFQALRENVNAFRGIKVWKHERKTRRDKGIKRVTKSPETPRKVKTFTPKIERKAEPVTLFAKDGEPVTYLPADGSTYEAIAKALKQATKEAGIA
jgi:hypothetical protein